MHTTCAAVMRAWSLELDHRQAAKAPGTGVVRADFRILKTRQVHPPGPLPNSSPNEKLHEGARDGGAGVPRHHDDAALLHDRIRAPAASGNPDNEAHRTRRPDAVPQLWRRAFAPVELYRVARGRWARPRHGDDVRRRRAAARGRRHCDLGPPTGAALHHEQGALCTIALLSQVHARTCAAARALLFKVP